MNVADADIEQVLKQLTYTPRHLAAASDGLGIARLHYKPGETAWSANDIVAHLRACADVWGKGITAMLTQDHPTLRYVSLRTWIRKANYLQLEFEPSSQAFAQQRQELLNVLQPLAREDWLRAAIFTETTRSRELTIFSTARRMAHHEHEQLQQFEAVLNHP